MADLLTRGDESLPSSDIDRLENWRIADLFDQWSTEPVSPSSNLCPTVNPWRVSGDWPDVDLDWLFDNLEAPYEETPVPVEAPEHKVTGPEPEEPPTKKQRSAEGKHIWELVRRDFTCVDIPSNRPEDINGMGNVVHVHAECAEFNVDACAVPFTVRAFKFGDTWYYGLSDVMDAFSQDTKAKSTRQRRRLRLYKDAVKQLPVQQKMAMKMVSWPLANGWYMSVGNFALVCRMLDLARTNVSLKSSKCPGPEAMQRLQEVLFDADKNAKYLA